MRAPWPEAPPPALHAGAPHAAKPLVSLLSCRSVSSCLFVFIALRNVNRQDEGIIPAVHRDPQRVQWDPDPSRRPPEGPNGIQILHEDPQRVPMGSRSFTKTPRGSNGIQILH
ncbi:hypothetical protein EYF80_064441 [Liparis tanakae]|uniref:Uncharacterized protein n=1 Tax=Liparis tanakae TaxID=230148 RepID=A0A4Z2E9E8_9TELE|nr:hypothetical protein EYF80_064441 [Liparis tanakae]